MAKSSHFDRNIIAAAAFIVLIVGGGIAGGAYLLVANKSVYIDKSLIQAPVIALSPSSPGILQEIYVNPGDMIPANTIVAQVGVELIKSTTAGLVVDTNENIGKVVTAQDAVVSMIDPSQLRVVGQVDEDKGLSSIHVGQPAIFTVDAFGHKQFTGIVDEVSPTSHQGDVVFNISDKRQIQTFDVKVKYDVAANPQLKNGMSAKLWVYKQ